MAATLKLGDRKWATKEGSLLAYNDENNNYKPLPFDFTRASSATRVNKQGLIETVASGVPRIDFTDANGALLLEPQRTNLVTYSEDFSNAAWTKSDATVVSGQVSPTGDTSAFKLVEGTGLTTYHQTYLGNIFTTVLNNYYTFSFFAKPAERTVVTGLLQPYNLMRVEFDLIAKTATVISGLNASGTIKEYSNGWFKCTVSGQSSQVLGAYVNIQSAEQANTSVWASRCYLGTRIEDNVSNLQVTLGRTATGVGYLDGFRSVHVFGEVVKVLQIADDGTYNIRYV